MKLRDLTLAGSLALLGGCAHDPYDAARSKDSPEAYQRALKEAPDDRQADMARTRLMELRWAEARAAHTPLAYKRFIEDFPTSEQAADAAKLLEALRFDAAQQANTARAYQEFLRDHPDGAHAPQARKQLEDLAWADAKAARSSKAVREYLGRFPETSRRVEAERLADDLSFEEARAAGPEGLSEYLQRASEGAHRDQARALLVTRDAEARAAAGDLPGALELARRLEGPDARALEARLAEEELEQVASTLDPGVLKAFASRHPGDPLGKQALQLADQLGKARGAKALREAVARLDPAAFGRPPEELIAVLTGGGDPRDRWLAAAELGELGELSALEPLLAAATEARFEEVRLRAFAALEKLFARMGPAAAQSEARRRLEGLRKVASGPHLFLKVAVLEELSGARAAARADYRRALRGDEEDLLALRRLAALEAEGRAGFTAAVTARRLAVQVTELARSRAQGEGDAPLLSARWYCGLAHDAEAAQAQLAAVPAEAARDFPEDLAGYRQKAEEAARALRARLADAEDLARAEKAGFQGCEADDVAPRLADGVKARLAAVKELGASREPLAAWPLRRAARLDPSAEVRAAARQALAAVAPTPAG